jgi:hypothetical protein
MTFKSNDNYSKDYRTAKSETIMYSTQRDHQPIEDTWNTLKLPTVQNHRTIAGVICSGSRQKS